MVAPTAPRRKALICVPSTTDVVGAGGVAPRWRQYLNELEAASWDVEVWRVDSAEESRRIPRCIHPFFPRTLTDQPSVKWMWDLMRALQQRRPDVLVVTDLFNDVNIGLLAYALRVPLAYSLHTDGSKLPGGIPAVASLCQAMTSRLASRTATTSPSFARVLVERGVCRKREVVYYAPLRCNELSEAPCEASAIAKERASLLGGCDDSDRRLVVYCGRWSAEKRIQLLVKCRTECPKEEKWTLAIVGDAADDRIAEEVEKFHDPPRVVVRRSMLRRGPELACCYRAADWVVSASDFETFGNVAHEAALCGTPAILQRGPGFVDQISTEPSDRGTLIDFGATDATAQFEAAMRRTEHLLARPRQVKAAASAYSENGRCVADVLEEAATRGANNGALPLTRAASLVGCFALAATLRVFVASYGAYLRFGLVVSSRVPWLLKRFRPPARRWRWAGSVKFLTSGSLRGSGIFRSSLHDWQRPPSCPMFNILPSRGSPPPPPETLNHKTTSSKDD